MSTTDFVPELRVACDAEDVIDVLALARFADGGHRVARQFALHEVDSAFPLVPPGSIVRVATADGDEHVLAAGGTAGSDDWLLDVHRRPGGWTQVWITGVDDEVVAKVEAAVRSNAPEPVDRPELLSVEFWYLRGQPQRRTRRIDAPTWAEVAANYPASTAPELDELMSLDDPGTSGRLIVWHGPPGTGKTTAARALLRSWRSWCRGLVITDPDRLFADPGYLMDVLVDDTDGDDGWRLLVIEDADDILRPDARVQGGAALARLLNSADGFIGQGVKVLVLLSTNQLRVAIDPAILRPGRCLAEIEFGLFEPGEARAWLCDAGVERPDRQVSLAELFRVRAGEPLVRTESPGQYL